MVLYLYLSSKIPDTDIVVGVLALNFIGNRIYQKGSLAYMAFLYILLGFHLKSNLLIFKGHGNRNPIFMNILHYEVLEVSISVRSEHQSLSDLDVSLQDSSTENQSKTFGLIGVVDHELGRDHLVDSGFGSWLLGNFHRLLQFAHEVSEHLATFAGCIGDLEHRAYFAGGYFLRDPVDVRVVLHQNWDLATVLLHDFGQRLQVVIQHSLWGDIDLGEDHKHRQAESEGNSEMLLGHLGDAHVGTHDDEGVVGEETGESEHGCLQVLLVTAHVQQVHHLVRVLHDVRPDFVLHGCVLKLGKVLTSFFGEAHDLVTN